jgi:hypothetical protein
MYVKQFINPVKPLKYQQYNHYNTDYTVVLIYVLCPDGCVYIGGVALLL